MTLGTEHEQQPAPCDWTTNGTVCGRIATTRRVEVDVRRERQLCAAHERTGETFGYWRQKAAP